MYRFLIFLIILFIYIIFHFCRFIFNFLTYILIIIVFVNFCNNNFVIDNEDCNFENYELLDNLFIFNHFIITNDFNNNFLSINFTKDIPPDIDNSINNHFLIYTFLISFLIKVLIKTVKRTFMLYIFILIILKLMSNNIVHNTKLTEHLKNSTKRVFFTIEIINASNRVSEIYLENDFCTLCLSKICCRTYTLFSKQKLLLSGDINPNPGPQFSETNIMWEPFKERGLHFIHININSLLPKIDELRSIAKNSNAAVIGITESKVDESVQDSEINIEKYNIIRCDRNRHGGGVVCYVRDDIKL